MIYRNLARALAMALAALTVGCHGRPAPGTAKNVLLVSIDTLRADRLGCQGRENAGTPVLDALAQRGVRFADASSPYPLTLPSHASLLTGQWPMRHGIRENGVFALADSATTLAERLSAKGLRAGAFVGSVVLAGRQGLSQGFEAYGEPGFAPGMAMYLLPERSAPEVNADVLRWIDGIGTEPFFAWVHYMEPHFPYTPPEPEKSRYPKDAYQGEVAATDRFLGELLAALESRGRLADTLVIVTADHGEDLGDHAEMTHGIFLYQSTLHVPLIMAGPGVRQGDVVEEPVSIVDVTPTIAEALGVTPPEAGAFDGVSLWPALHSGKTPAGDRPLYAETFVTRNEFGWSELRALRVGPDKYISAPRPEFYDVVADPGERTDRISRNPKEAAVLKERLAAAVAAGESAGGSGQHVELSESEREALQSLGYLQGSGGADPAGALADPKDRVNDAVLLDKGYWLMRHGKPDESRKVLEGLLEANPRFSEARLALLILMLGLGDEARAAAIVADIDRASAEAGHGAAGAARGHLVFGEWLAKAGRTADARVHYEAALAAPQAPDVHVTLARLQAELGDVTAARETLGRLEARGALTSDGRALKERLDAASP